ncbi:DUF559 domain-containing protein [Flexilinea flocculi]
MNGINFRRQHPVGKFIVDFLLCPIQTHHRNRRRFPCCLN